MTCSIEGCGGKVVAKGLCAKHYMRQRRGGDPTAKRKTGPKPRPRATEAALYTALAKGESATPRDIADGFYPHWSERTRARWAKAMEIVDWLRAKGVDVEALQNAARFRNGEPNVSGLLETAIEIARPLVAVALAEEEDDGS
jgi:hypothetical protein